MKQENVFFISMFTFMVCALLIGFEVCMNSYVIVIMIIAMISASLSTIDLDNECDYDDEDQPAMAIPFLFREIFRLYYEKQEA